MRYVVSYKAYFEYEVDANAVDEAIAKADEKVPDGIYGEVYNVMWLKDNGELIDEEWFEN